MSDVFYLMFDEFLGIYVMISYSLYQSAKNNTVLFIFICVLFVGLLSYLIYKNRKKLILSPIILLLFFITISFVFNAIIGSQVSGLIKIGNKLVEKIDLDKKNGYNIPENIKNIDSNYFSQIEINTINECFLYKYFNKDTLKKKYKVNVNRDIYDLTLYYRLYIYTIQLKYDSDQNKFIFWFD